MKVIFLDQNIDRYVQNARKRLEPGKKEETQLKKADIKGNVTIKKSLGRKFTDALIGSDISDVGQFLLWDCFVPALKYAIIDSVLIIFGEGPARRNGGYVNNYNKTNVNYGGYSSLNNQRNQNNNNRTRNFRHSTDEIAFDYREDAEEVLDILVDMVSEFGHVTVAQVFDQAGITVDDFTMNDWGWTDLSSVKIKKYYGYWIMDFPKPISLK